MSGDFKMSRLYIGDVLEVVIDKYQNKGYLIYLAKHIPIGFKMFGLYAIHPTIHGCNINEIKNKKIISTIMIFEDENWQKIGKLKLENFIWPDQYERDLNDNNKYIVYHWGDGEEKRIISGHPWVYANEVLKIEGKDKNGSLCTVRSADGRFIGRGFINHLSKILVRIISRNESEVIDELPDM